MRGRHQLDGPGCLGAWRVHGYGGHRGDPLHPDQSGGLLVDAHDHDEPGWYATGCRRAVGQRVDPVLRAGPRGCDDHFGVRHGEHGQFQFDHQRLHAHDHEHDDNHDEYDEDYDGHDGHDRRPGRDPAVDCHGDAAAHRLSRRRLRSDGALPRHIAFVASRPILDGSFAKPRIIAWTEYDATNRRSCVNT